MGCSNSYTSQEGYVKRKVFDITTEEDLAIGSVLPIGVYQGESIIIDVTIPFLEADLGVVSLAVLTNDGNFTTIIPKLTTDFTTTWTSTGTVPPTFPIISNKINAAVKPVGANTTLIVNDLHTIVNNVLADPASTIGGDIDRENVAILNADSYILAITSAADIPTGSRFTIAVNYQGTV